MFSSVAQLCPTLCDPMDCSLPGLPVYHQLLDLFKLMSIESVMPSNYLILCHPLLLPPSVFPRIRVFSNKSVLCIRWPKYWTFSFNISPSNEYSGLISFRMNWLDLPAVQGNLESSPTPQFQSINSSALSFRIVQLSHPYMTTGKTRALTRWIFLGKVTVKTSVGKVTVRSYRNGMWLLTLALPQSNGNPGLNNQHR